MKLNKNNYYSQEANKYYMSYSQFKDFLKCPAYAMAKIKGEWQDECSDSLLVGSYVDSWLDGELDKFQEEHPEIFNSRTGELKANFKQAEELCKIIKQDDFMYKLLKGKRQKIMTGYIAGVPFKVKIDSLHDDMIVDGKVLKDCEDCWIDGKYPFYMEKEIMDHGVILLPQRESDTLVLSFIPSALTPSPLSQLRLAKRSISSQFSGSCMPRKSRIRPSFSSVSIAFICSSLASASSSLVR